MDVQVVYSAGCPSWQAARERLVQALRIVGAGRTVVSVQRLASDAEARAAGFAGSPTILVDGQDLFPGAPPASGPACRVYPTADGPAGAPTVADLVRALSERGSP